MNSVVGSVRPASAVSTVSAELIVRSAGRAAIQDLGRPGYERLGIAVNGAADQVAAEVANTLVGNAGSAALIEILASDFAFECSAPVLLAVTGAPATLTVDELPRRMWEPLCLEPRQRVSISRIHHGLRTYVAVAGDLTAQYVMGSCAPDSLLQVGRYLSAADIVEIATRYRGLDHPFFRHPLFALRPPVPAYGARWRVPVTEGPDLDDYDAGLQQLAEATYTVGMRSNHIGLRLDGPVPSRRVRHEILSRGVPVGAIEAPPGTGLLALQRGRPVTAGYPVVAVATQAGRRALGQAAPGHTVHFEASTVDQALAAHAATIGAIAGLRHRVRTAFDSLALPHAFERTSA